MSDLSQPYPEMAEKLARSLEDGLVLDWRGSRLERLDLLAADPGGMFPALALHWDAEFGILRCLPFGERRSGCILVPFDPSFRPGGATPLERMRALACAVRNGLLPEFRARAEEELRAARKEAA